MTYLALSASFEYLCYESTAIINICFHLGPSLSVFIRQNLTYKDGPRTERVNAFSAGINFKRQNLTSVDVRF